MQCKYSTFAGLMSGSCQLHKTACYVQKTLLSYDVASGSEITQCNKIDKPLVVYRFTGNIMTPITTLRHNDKIITFLRQKYDFKVFII